MDYGGVGPGTPGFWAARLALCKGPCSLGSPGHCWPLAHAHVAGHVPWATPRTSKIRQSPGAFSVALCFQAQALGQSLLLTAGPLSPTALSWPVQLLGAAGILCLVVVLLEGIYKANTKAAWEFLKACFPYRMAMQGS